MKKILVLGAGQMQVPVIQKINKRGDIAIAADMNVNAPGMQYADIILNISTDNTNAILEVAKKLNIDGILTTSDYPVNVVAAVGEELGLPSMSRHAANICTNKYLQRDILSKGNVNCPRYKLVFTEKEIETGIDFPFVIKPVDSSASRGVRRIDSFNDLHSGFSSAKAYSRDGYMIVEQYIEGKEYSVETLTQFGRTTIIAITEKATKGEEFGFFVEDTHRVPARLTKQEVNMIETEVLRALNVIGVDNCPTHTEVKLWDGKVYIIEIACRLGGDYITSDLVPLSTGVDMLENLIRISTGENINIDVNKDFYSAIQFLNQDNYNKCVEFIQCRDFRMVRYDVQVRHERKIMNSLDRMGYIILQASSRDELEEVLSSIN